MGTKFDYLFVVAGKGGHLTQAMRFISHMPYEIILITDDNHSQKLTKISRLKERVHHINSIVDKATGRTDWPSVVKNTIKVTWIFLRKRPKLIISFGPDIGLLTCLISKLFGAKIINVESWCRFSSHSRTFIYLSKISDLDIVQNPELLIKSKVEGIQYFGRL